MGEVSGGTAQTAFIELVGPKGMLYPGLSDLFEAVGVIRPATHSIEIVRNDRMVRTWQHKKINWQYVVSICSVAGSPICSDVRDGSGGRGAVYPIVVGGHGRPGQI